MMKSQVALLYVLIIMSGGSAQSLKPRRSVFFSDVNLKLFKEPDFDSLSSLLVREDIGLLFIGARGKVITLSLDDITEKTSETNWMVSSEGKSKCQKRGRSIEECDNYIRLMHTLDDGRILICGTNAFDPTCTHLMVNKGNVIMENTTERGRGKIPFDPEEKFASMMDDGQEPSIIVYGEKLDLVVKCKYLGVIVDPNPSTHSYAAARNDLYTASSVKSKGQKISFIRHGENMMMNQEDLFLSSEPTMISIHMAEISKSSENNEDDNVFLFLVETGFEDPRKLRLSRVARVCKSDIGGTTILRKKWTSFLEVRLDCPFGDMGSPGLVQDVFFLRDENNLTNSIFYAIFTTDAEPSSTCSQYAVCAYKLSDIQQGFKGKFLMLSQSGDWVTYEGKFAFLYPFSCINDEMRKDGKRTSQNFPDSSHSFVTEHPLLNGTVKPITGRPLLVWSAAQFSRIVVDKVTSLDGQQHNVMFISNNSGWLQKAVWSGDDGGRIIEELQLFQDPQPIRFLQLSSRSGHLYSTTRTAVAQLSVRDCSRYTSCADCLIARDPYCGWDRLRCLCAAVAGASNFSMIQNLTDGDVGVCPKSHLSKQITDIHLTVDVAQFLPCSPDTNLPISWSFSGNILEPGPRHILLSQGLILTPSFTDEGLYTCETVEVVKGRKHRKAVILYNVKVAEGGGTWIQAIIIYILASVCVLCVMLIIYLTRKQKARNHVGSNCGSDDTTEQPELKTGSCHCGNSGFKNQNQSSGSCTKKIKPTGVEKRTKSTV